jgi:putative membrane protein
MEEYVYRMAPFSLICGGLLFLLVVAVLIALAVWALRSYGRGGSPTGMGPVRSPGPGTPDQPVGPGSSRALEILRERYARGEITKEQFDAMRQDILG